MQGGHTGGHQGWTGGRRSEAKMWKRALIEVFEGRNERGKVSWLSMNNSNTFSHCLVLHPRVIRTGGQWPRV